MLRKLGPESKLLDVVQQTVDAGSALVVINILEQLLEHTCSSTRCRNKLHNLRCRCSLVITRLSLRNLLVAHNQHAIACGSRANDFQVGKTFAEVINLLLDLSLSQTVLLNLL